jgi:hypothetical protein
MGASSAINSPVGMEVIATDPTAPSAAAERLRKSRRCTEEWSMANPFLDDWPIEEWSGAVNGAA